MRTGDPRSDSQHSRRARRVILLRMQEFEEVYRAYGASVRAYLARLTGDAWLADELQQETFYR